MVKSPVCFWETRPRRAETAARWENAHLFGGKLRKRAGQFRGRAVPNSGPCERSTDGMHWKNERTRQGQRK